MTSSPTSDTAPITPMLSSSSPLDERQRDVVRRVADAEYAKILQLPTDDPLDPKRRRRVEITRTELVTQPEAIAATWDRNAHTIGEVADRLAGADIRRAYLVGAGDSLAVMIAVRQLLEWCLGVPCEPVQSLDFAYYNSHLVDAHTLVVTLSSSGETTRTVEAALVAQHAGALTLALSNTEASTLVAESQEHLIIEATRAGWPTQASTAAMALLLRVGLDVGLRRGLSGAERTLSELARVPDLMDHVVRTREDQVAEIAQREADRPLYLFSGGGPSWATATIGAAKVKECSPDHALAVHVEEFHHYNSQKPGEPLWMVAPAGHTVARARDTVREAIRYRGRPYVVTTESVADFGDVAEVVVVPDVPEPISPLVCVVPVQLFGYHVAMAKFAVAEERLEA